MPRLLVHETAIHWIDTFRFLMGEVAAVYAWLRKMNPVIAGEDAGYIVFEFAGGATGLFDGNRLNDHVAANPRRTMGEMWLEGERGRAAPRWRGAPVVEAAPEGGGRASLRPRPGRRFGGGCCLALQRHVVRHLLAGTALENRGRDYLVNLRVEEAVYRSNAEGQGESAVNVEPFGRSRRPSACTAAQGDVFVSDWRGG